MEKEKEEFFEHTATYNQNVYNHVWTIVFTNDMKKHVKDTLKHHGATKKEIKFQLPSKNTVAQVMNVDLKNKLKWDVVVFDINKYSSSTGVHESFHIVKEMLWPRGIKLKKDLGTEEAYAYLLGNVFDAVATTYECAMKKYKKFKKDEKNKQREAQ